MLVNPQVTWEQVRAESGSASVFTLLFGYALWWVLWAIGGTLLVTLGWSGVIGRGLAGVFEGFAPAFNGAAWAALIDVFSWCAVLVVAYFVLFRQVKSQSAERVRLTQQLLVYSLTPVCLLTPLALLPHGSWAVCAGIGYSLYVAYTGLTQINSQPPENGVMVQLAVFALLLALMFTPLGWLMLFGTVWVVVIGGVIWVNSRDSFETWRDRMDVFSSGLGSSGQTTKAAGESEAVLQREGAVVEEPAAVPPAFSPAEPHANASKIAALDKKIARATDQGDMALVSKLLGDRAQLQQPKSNDF